MEITEYERDSILDTLRYDEYDYILSHHSPIEHLSWLVFLEECSSFTKGRVIVPTYDTILTEYVYISGIQPKGKYCMLCP